jgi:Glyoxalase/Bleomycin resistance protein/Dioxygenase superfamily
MGKRRRSAPPFVGLGHLRLFFLPQDWEAGVEFYTGMLRIPLLERNEDRGYALGLLAKNSTLSIERVDPGDPSETALAGRFVGVSMVVRDLRKSWKLLTEQGVAFDGPPQVQAWGGMVNQFRDPGGNVLTLLQYPKKARRS